MSDFHTHPRTGEWAVFWVPADTDIPMELKVVTAGWQSLQVLVDGYLEEINNDSMPELHCGCPMMMLANEEGQFKHLEQNVRASLYSSRVLVGDVVFLGTGPVGTDDDWELDLFGLPPEMNRWEGPGSPLPNPEPAPWEAR